MVPPEFVDAVISERLLEVAELRRQDEARKAQSESSAPPSALPSRGAPKVAVRYERPGGSGVVGGIAFLRRALASTIRGLPRL